MRSRVHLAEDIAWVPGQPGITRVREAIEAQTYPNPVAHPLGPPTVSGTTMTVDLALQSPTRVTRSLMDLTLQRFFADRVFASGGGVTGGAIVYDALLANDLYSDRDIQRVAPGDEFPLVTSSRRAPFVAEVEKWGGKFFLTVEARDRNDISVFTRNVRMLANTIVRKINQRSVEALEAAIQQSPVRTVTGVNWATVVTAGASASNSTLWPGYDFSRAQAQAEVEELGIVYDLWIINPQEYLQLARIYGPDLNNLLASMGLEIFVTNRVAAGNAYVVQQGAAGQMRVEQPLQTRQWYEEDTERFWTQSSVRPLWFVDNRFAVLKFTNLAG
ncbi:MAG TPA: major capsid protein [bacterium]|nr:major capsid protein [bacterium]